MIAFGHSAIGAVVGYYSYTYLAPNDPVVGLLAAGTIGVVSHYITDIIPHGHFFVTEKNFKRNITLTIIFDFFAAILLFAAAAYYGSQSWLKVWYILFGIGGANLPDIVDNLVYMKIIPDKGFFKWQQIMHMNTHWHGKNENALLIGILDLWQVAAVILALWLLI